MQNFNEFLKSFEGYNDSRMNRSELLEIEKFARMLIQKIDSGVEIPSWGESQISVAANDLNGIYQYLESKFNTNNF